jgi:hypothetical protein
MLRVTGTTLTISDDRSDDDEDHRNSTLKHSKNKTLPPFHRKPAALTSCFFFLLLLYTSLFFLLTHLDAAPENSSPQNSTVVGVQNHTTPRSIPILHPWDDKETILNLPTWMSDYIAWHKRMRQAFPGELLFSHPNAPKLLIRTCLSKCGGLHDRLGKLPWDMFLANQTKRLLLIHWCQPAPLQTFLEPNELDWTMPPEQVLFLNNNSTTCPQNWKRILHMFQGGKEERGADEFWKDGYQKGLELAKTGEHRRIKIMRHQMLGSETVLKQELEALGETDTVDWTLTFGRLFWAFFRPTQVVLQELESTMNELHLTRGEYSAVHCRVRHPKAIPKTARGKNGNPRATDRMGLLWDGHTRDYAVATANRALACGQTLLQSDKEPVYFFADSEDLVRYMTQEAKDPGFLQANSSIFDSNPIMSTSRRILERVNVVGRVISTETLHIDRQAGREPSAYMGTFVDLLIGAMARCITFSIGNYALFAAKISGTPCRLKHQIENRGAEKGHYMTHNVCPSNVTVL